MTRSIESRRFKRGSRGDEREVYVVGYFGHDVTEVYALIQVRLRPSGKPTTDIYIIKTAWHPSDSDK